MSWINVLKIVKCLDISGANEWPVAFLVDTLNFIPELVFLKVTYRFATLERLLLETCSMGHCLDGYSGTSIQYRILSDLIGSDHPTKPDWILGLGDTLDSIRKSFS